MRYRTHEQKGDKVQNGPQPHVHGQDYNMCARRAATLADPWLTRPDLDLPYDPYDHLSPMRWSSDVAKKRGRQTHFLSTFPKNLRDGLRSHADTKRFASSYKNTLLS